MKLNKKTMWNVKRQDDDTENQCRWTNKTIQTLKPLVFFLFFKTLNFNYIAKEF